jgi:hypothetical protein
MSVTTEGSTSIPAIRPFRIEILEADVEDLRTRLAVTRAGDGPFDAFDVPTVPVGVTAFAAEIYRTPRSWGEKVFGNLIYSNELDRGGHFTAWEQATAVRGRGAGRIQVAALIRARTRARDARRQLPTRTGDRHEQHR